MPFVSLVIPVYNVEKYLKQCIDSVLKQNIPDIEIILVDDGSTDDSRLICDEYKSKYDNIIVVHKKNGGLSSARNTGIDKANGKYLMFMDSDDWWNPNVALMQIFDIVRSNKDVEMFLFTSYDYFEGEGYFIRNEHNQFSKIDDSSVNAYYKSLIDNGNLEVSACTKIIKKNFLVHNELYFKNDLLGEDNEWMIRVLRKLASIKVIDEHLYICRGNRTDSITHTIKKKNVEDLLSIVEDCLAYNENNKYWFKDFEMCFAAYLWFAALGLSIYLKKEEQRSVKELFKRTIYVLDYSNSKKTRYSKFVYNVLGHNITVHILGVYIKLKGKYKISRTKVDI